MQYRTDAQYVPMAEAKGMKTNHVAGTPLRGEGVGVSVQNMMGHQRGMMRPTKRCKDEPYDLEREREHRWWMSYSNIRGPEVG